MLPAAAKSALPRTDVLNGHICGNIRLNKAQAARAAEWKSNMKKITVKAFALIMALATVFGMTACGGETGSTGSIDSTGSAVSVISGEGSGASAPAVDLTLPDGVAEKAAGYTNPFKDDINVKPVLLYVGYAFGSTSPYPEFTDEDIQSFTAAGMDEFILIDGSSVNTYYDVDENGDPVGEARTILTEDIVNTLTTDLIGPNAGSLATMVQNYSKNVKEINKDLTLNRQTEYELELAERILRINPDAKLWFNLTPVSCMALAEYYAKPFMDVCYKMIKAKLSDEVFNKNFMGMYWATEDTGPWDTAFDKNNNVDFNNALIRCAKYCSDILHADGKTLFWIPFTATEQQIERIGWIANTSNVFDAVFLQAGYIWHAEYKSMIDLLDRCTEAGAVINSAGVVYGGSKTSDTLVGPEIEIDNNIVFNNDGQLERYLYEYERLIRYKDTRPIAIYGDSELHLAKGEVFSRVCKWFD